MKEPTELTLNETQEGGLARRGFIGLMHVSGETQAVFMAAESAHRQKEYDDDDASENESLHSGIQYLLATSRFAHTAKAILRELIGAAVEEDEIQTRMSRWLSSYVLLNGSPLQKCKMPLKEARVEVKRQAGRLGFYEAKIFLVPHIFLKGVDASLSPCNSGTRAVMESFCISLLNDLLDRVENEDGGEASRRASEIDVVHGAPVRGNRRH